MRHLLLILLLALSGRLAAADLALTGLAADDPAVRTSTLAAIGTTQDPRLVAFLEDYRQGSAYLWQGRIVLAPTLGDTTVPLDPLTRESCAGPQPKSAFTELPVARRERLAAGEAITLLRLSHPDAAVRLAAALKAGDSGGATNRTALAARQPLETDPRIARALTEGLALIDLGDAVPTTRAAAAQALGALSSTRALTRLREVATADPDPTVTAAAKEAIARAEQWQRGVRIAQTAFAGLSAGSILIVMALGLAVTFGLMGVINMAHGEMLMLGAYATLLVQMAFQHLPPALMPWYFPVGLVTGFLAAGVVGWLLELTIIRHLYGRPLETLLATWGISYLLIQTVRSAFGDNRAVTAPAYLVGGWEPVADLVLPWNRLFIIVFTALSVVGVALVLSRTRLGLLLRATTQSRRTASSLGVDTRRIDGLTFALGSGLAGAAGCALTLIGGLKPDMGQEFIIDSFLVVAAGGVGNLAGVVWAGLGLGLLNKILEPWTQAVFAKVIVLGLVMLFLQKRPAGLFPPKGRLADV